MKYIQCTNIDLLRENFYAQKVFTSFSLYSNYIVSIHVTRCNVAHVTRRNVFQEQLMSNMKEKEIDIRLFIQSLRFEIL